MPLHASGVRVGRLMRMAAICGVSRHRQAEGRPSMESVGDCYDNTLRESFFV